jgi:type VI secretion system protein
MTLILTIRNAEAMQPGMSPSFTPERDTAILGRSKNCDWHLPDPKNAISSRHAELRRDGDGWVIKDISTNGTFINGATERMCGEHRIADGDTIRIGDYEIGAKIAADAPIS